MKEPTFRKRTETISSESPSFRVDVRCDSTRLEVPPELPREVGALTDAMRAYGPAEMRTPERVEAIFTIKIHSADREQQVQLTLPELFRVFRTVQKVIPSQSRHGLMPPDDFGSAELDVISAAE